MGEQNAGLVLHEVLGEAQASAEAVLIYTRQALPMAKEDPNVSHDDVEALKAVEAAAESCVQVLALLAVRKRLEVARD